MDITEYFRIVSTSGRVLHLENKGFWSEQVARQLGGAMLAQFRKAAKEVSREGPFIVLADLRELDVLSRQGKVILSRVMQCAKDYGIYKSVEIVPNAITKLSIREAAELTGQPNFRVMTGSFDEAITLVETLKQEMLAAESVESSAS
ncbi:MAG: hypothetical protein JW888_14305 [Pirellulales bacterium]|nr:hypothetical protein [Pirellulales bacterium]